ncbi:MAG TPA: UDP-N-acetylmuramoyl-tripeptide--D-alanyl-D-alanine ligase [Bacteroidales bacterium]|mgnify:CR=1 FL=1|nr:UDP-N-acetylmuramoyl-tripeptide--D-alanyl-D-alanine ligase [Bacteroidales bacterium]HPJ59170.1 UDP-N-acetylmuramoyl-tripeptide--D-alanyl-D-alanine ligase [Bacteroidales bacterium]HPR12782.1 UDP-N-acetylmuramoyl-tripeptide--D-alanyl-D-alanine ligase [Bacteroidales bacterium]HRW84386.1 UDP-N-acetylmuramoyl-tripeptide--D-alanyl-D-alanine ligase [Bacteroidales bacterium]
MKTELLYSLFRESTGISTDSRNVKKGEIFFALWGDKYNGNTFAAGALAKGASWAVIDDPAFETEKTILVDDTLFELQALASHYRKEMKAEVLAITGTNGKTTTKELIAAILGKKYKVHSTQGNLNNHIGVPLTILSAPEGTEMMVLEMGANHVGEVRTLCHIAKPDFGIITNISPAHIEGFGSFEGVVRAKTELYEHLRKINGVALYNDNDNLLSEKIFKLVNRAVPFSNPSGIKLELTAIPSDLNLRVNVKYRETTRTISTRLFGGYNIENLRAAIATGLFFGVDMNDIAAEVEKYEPVNNRSQVMKTKKNTVICDSYNANPSSMKKALESFAALEAQNKVCILGDMLEMGDRGEEEHTRIHRILTDHNLLNVMLVGPVFTRVSAGFRFKTFHDVSRLKEYLKLKPLEGCHILVKGSRGIMLEQVYEML